MPTDSVDCLATAAVLRSGGSAAQAAHVAMIVTMLRMRAPWLTACAVAVWLAVVYLSIRVRIDVHLFELLAGHPADRLDEWLASTGLRKSRSSRTMPERRGGAMRLWRVLVFAAAIQIALMAASLLA